MRARQTLTQIPNVRHIRNIFRDVAKRYDIMNDAMSLGMHRAWKNQMIDMLCPIKKGGVLLDLAGGTGDLSIKFVRRYMRQYTNSKTFWPTSAYICDISREMLAGCLDKTRCDSKNQKFPIPIYPICGNAASLPFSDNSFDYCTVGFGIRNMENIPGILKEIMRVLKPGGRFLCMEFINPKSSEMKIKILYDVYSFLVIPALGKLIANNVSAYKYLVSSIRLFPVHDKFIGMIKDSGFGDINAKILSLGIVGIYSGHK